MAAKKKKKAASKKGAAQHKKFEVSGLILIALGVFLFVGIFTNTVGPVGEWIKQTLFGIIGFAGYVIPVLLVFLGCVIIISGHESINWKDITVWSLFALCAMSLIHVFFFKGMDVADFIEFEQQTYAFGAEQFNGGGLIGGAFCFLLKSFIGQTGTVILLILLVLIILILKTSFSIRKLSTNIGDNVRNISESFSETFRQPEKPVEVRGERLFVGNLNGNEIDENRRKPELAMLNSTKFETIGQHEHEKDPLMFGQDGMDFHEPKQPQQATLFDPKPADESPEARKTPDKAKEPEQPEKPKPVHEHDEAPKEYIKPPYNLLTKAPKVADNSAEEINRGAALLEDTLLSFGISSKVVNVSRGPAITRYELQPAPGVKISRIVNLSNDIALSMAAPGVRIEAPIPGKAAIGVEVPNAVTSLVKLRDVLETPEFMKMEAAMTCCLGKDIAGKNIVTDLAKMPHLLIAGATGMGKSVCINSLIISILYKSSPEQVRMLMVDPKVVELNVYNGVPHLLIPVVTDPKKAAGALNWAVQEMLRRYAMFAEKGTRDLQRYNDLVANDPEAEKLPQILIVVDELADLMMAAPNEVEDSICRLAQMARAAGMHLVIATQRPSVDVITGVIKANIPSRIAFAVSSQVDSRTILDVGGAEKLLGRGDMLFSPSGSNKPIRIQGAYITENEVEKVIEFIKQQMHDVDYDSEVINNVNSYELPTKKSRGGGGGGSSDDDDGGDDEYSERQYDSLLKNAAEVVFETGQASISMVQRRLRVGYARAARLVDELEELGIVSPSMGSKPRDIMKSRIEAIQTIEQYR